MNSVPFTYIVDWKGTNAETRWELLEAYAAAGAKNIVLCNQLVSLIAADSSFRRTLHKEMERNGLVFVDGHAQFNPESTFTAPDGLRKQMLARQKFAMQIFADNGVVNCCYHVGKISEYPGMSAVEGADNIRRALEVLVKEAEKLGVVLCLENIFHPLNTSKFLLQMMSEFTSPNLGVCFDCGHANIMEKGKGDPDCIMLNRWQLAGYKAEEIEWEENMLDKLLPHIVMCHLHDNNALRDQHQLPGNGCVDFKKVFGKLKNAPRLTSMQSEVLAASNLASPAELCAAWQKVLKENQ